jgi:hypothetical protein
VLRELKDKPVTELEPPWSPLSVCAIGFLLPAGGAVLTIMNLRRLHRLDLRQTRLMIGIVITILIVGNAALFLSAPVGANGIPHVDPEAMNLIGFGTALASLVAQRTAFRQWRAAHLRERTSSWLRALGIAAICMAGVFAVSLGLYLLLARVSYAS